MERLKYPKQYVREIEDSFTNKVQKSFGFKTTSTTRPVILADLVQVVRDNPELVNDADTLDEMLTFVRNTKGRPEAQQGSHDDLIIGLAIAHYIRSQQKYNVAVDKPAEQQHPFNFNKKPRHPLGLGGKNIVI